MNRLAELNLKTNSNKEELQNRLKTALEIDEEEPEDDDDLESEGLSEGGASAVISVTSRNNIVRTHPTLTFKNVEDASKTFSGDGTENSYRWVTNSRRRQSFVDGRKYKRLFKQKYY